MTWINCEDILTYNESFKCQDLHNPFVCKSSPNQTTCLEDIQCDGTYDCLDGTDELDCDRTVPYQCDFNNGILCSKWSLKLFTERNEATVFKSSKYGESSYDGIKALIPSNQRHPYRDGYLIFSPKILKDNGSKAKMNTLQTPTYPPNSHNRYRICTVRFDYCTNQESYDFSLHIRNVKNQTRRLWNVPHITSYSRACEWKRAIVVVGRQPYSFHLEFNARYHRHVQLEFIAIDNFSSSPHCFDKGTISFRQYMAELSKHSIIIILIIMIIIMTRRFIAYVRHSYKVIKSFIVETIKLIETNRILQFIRISQLSSKDEIFQLSNLQLLKKLPTLPRSKVTFQSIIGYGAFGEVFRAQLEQNDEIVNVAVKVLNEKLMETEITQREFILEAVLMRSSNTAEDATIKVIGASFEEIPHMVVMELMTGGSLLEYLRSCRPTKECSNPQKISSHKLMQFVMDIAQGCAIIEKLQYVHRDLAARNCLLTHLGPGMRVKIGDFGLANELYSAKSRTRALIPIKWMPLEAIEDGFFCAKTDVWSFGVVCWEIFSLGTIPYPTSSVVEVVERLRNGERLACPSGTPPTLYKLMQECWATYPECRPTFEYLYSQLEGMADTNEISECDIFNGKRTTYMWNFENEKYAFTDELLYNRICVPYRRITDDQRHLLGNFWIRKGYLSSHVIKNDNWYQVECLD